MDEYLKQIQGLIDQGEKLSTERYSPFIISSIGGLHHALNNGREHMAFLARKVDSQAPATAPVAKK